MRVVRRDASVSPSDVLRGTVTDPQSCGIVGAPQSIPEVGLVDTTGPVHAESSDVGDVAGTEFPRAARLLKASDFARLRGISRRIGTRHFSAEVAANAHPGARLGLAISKRVSKKAVRRNRIKRIARDSFRGMRNGLPAVDILIVARSSADLEPNAVLRAELAQLWERIATLNGTRAAGTMRD